VTTVRLDPPQPLEFLAELPVRFRMSPAALRLLTDGDEGADSQDAADELARLGLVDAVGQPHREARRALSALLAPEVAVDIDVSVRRAEAARGNAWLHSCQGLRSGGVTAVSSAGGAVELAWFDDDYWQTELARAASVRPPVGSPEAPLPRLDLPLDAVLAGGEALRTGRGDVFEELVDRSVGVATAPDGVLSRSDLHAQLVLLHGSTVGCLRASVAASEDRRARVGWVSWLLVADGWRSLTPLMRSGERLVRVEPAVPLDLGRQVAALVTAVRSRS
jgi:hypothetical protein